MATGIATIGVAKSILVGGHAPPPAKGARTPFLIEGEQVGVALRSRTGVKPLIVSPGHRIGIDAAADQCWPAPATACPNRPAWPTG